MIKGRVIYNLRVPDKLDRQVRKKAKAKDLSLAAAVRQALREWVDETFCLKKIFANIEALYPYIRQGILSPEEASKIAEIEKIYITLEGHLDIEFKHFHPFQGQLKRWWFRKIIEKMKE